MLSLQPSVQSPRAYFGQLAGADIAAKLSSDQITARIVSAVTATTRGRMRQALQDGAWRYDIHPAETAAGLTVGDLVFGTDPLNVNRYGVNTTPGTTDMTPAFDAAISVAVEMGGGLIDVPPGDYGVTNIDLPTGVYLCGPLLGEAIGSMSSGGARLIALATGNVVSSGTAGATFNCGVQGLHFVGLGAGTPLIGVYLDDATWATVRWCSFHSFADNAIKATANSGASTFEGNFAINCLMNRTRVQVDGVLDIDGADHRVLEGEYTASLNARSSANLRCAAVAARGANHFIQNTVGEISDVGWYVTASRSRIIAVRGDLNFGPGFNVSGSSRFVGCDAMNNSQHAAGTYSGWLVSVANNDFVGCGSDGVGAGQHKDGFEDSVNSNSKNRYLGCHAAAYAALPFNTQGFAGAQVSFPDGPPRAFTAADTTPSVAQYNNFASSGAAMTNFDDGVSGQVIRVLGDGTASVVNGATIKTNTALNKTLVANKVYTFMLWNGTWYEAE